MRAACLSFLRELVTGKLFREPRERSAGWVMVVMVVAVTVQATEVVRSNGREAALVR